MSEDKIIAVRFPRLYKSVRLLFTEVLGIVREKLGEPQAWPRLFSEYPIQLTGQRDYRLGRERGYRCGLIPSVAQAATMDSYKTACVELKARGTKARPSGTISVISGPYFSVLL